MPLRQIPVGDATANQLRAYLEASGVPVSRSQQRDKTAMRQLHDNAVLGDNIWVSDEPRAATPIRPDDMTSRFADDFDLDDERWCRLNLQADQNSKNRDSVVPVIHKNISLFLPRMKDIVIRERFLRVLDMAVERRVTQATDTEGRMSLNAQQVTLEHRYPFHFLGFYGKVSDGPPEGIPDDVQVYHQ